MKLQNKKILVTGGTGLIGRQLVEILTNKNNDVVTCSMDDHVRAYNQYKHVKIDLRHLNDVNKLVQDFEIVFHLAGIKGSPKLTATRPASFMVPMLMFNTNIINAMANSKTMQWGLYTSSIGVYAPSKIFYEDDVWTSFPSQNDKFAGWAKRMGELQIEAHAIERRGKPNISIIRPANTYGPYDNFDLDTCMVIPATIRKVLEGNGKIDVWGDGTNVRDFAYSKDVAEQMIFMIENEIIEPLNAGSGIGYTIKQLVDTIIKESGLIIETIYNTNKPSGDTYRIMDMNKALSYGYKPKYSLDQGIAETIKWYKNSTKEIIENRYDAFK